MSDYVCFRCYGMGGFAWAEMLRLYWRGSVNTCSVSGCRAHIGWIILYRRAKTCLYMSIVSLEKTMARRVVLDLRKD